MHSPWSSWTPLCSGARADRCRAVIASIADDLRTSSYAPDEVASASLASGRAGISVFLLHAARALDRPDLLEDAREWWDASIDGLASAPIAPSLFSGYAGVAWAALHLQDRLFPRDDDLPEEIDEALLELLDVSPWTATYDLVSGLVGFGVYFLERLPHRNGVLGLTRVMQRLRELAEESQHGVTWHTPPEALSPHQREMAPRGYYNLGLAHGVPGVLALLARVSAEMERSEATELPGARNVARLSRELVEPCVRWLLHQRLPGPSGLRFDSWIFEERRTVGARVAWCYGDLGVSAALLLAAEALDRDDWRESAAGLAGQAGSLRGDEAGVQDAGLCHGAAGVMHVLARMAHADQNEALRAEATSWLDVTLGHHQPGLGIGGYRAGTAGTHDATEWRDEPGVLMGSAGVGLALVAAVDDEPPAWDRFLLISGIP